MTTDIAALWPYFDTIWQQEGLRYPYGSRPGFGARPEPNLIESQEVWEGYQWNPPQYQPQYTTPDPDADPKPTWEEVQITAQKARIIQSREQAFSWIRWTPDDVRREFTDAAHLPDPIGIHVGAGLDHMTGLADMARASALAGARMPHVVMRDKDQALVSLYHTGELEPVLEATRRRENVVESAHNAVMARYHAQAKVRDDESQDLDKRETAAAAALKIAEDYEAELKKEIAAYDPDALPADLETLKATLIERLEAAAMAKVKAIRGALSQQGMDLPASCDDKADALQEVSKQNDLGRIRISRQRSVKRVKEAFDKAVAAINRVSALNTPHWTVAGKKVNEANPAEQAVTGREVKVESRHPDGATIDGEPVLKGQPAVTDTVTGKAVTDFGWFPDTGGQAVDGGTVRLRPAPAHPNPVRIVWKAENLCGESTLAVLLDAKAPSP